MEGLPKKRTEESLTFIVNSRVDVRKFAYIMYTWEQRGMPAFDISSAVRKIIHLYSDSLKRDPGDIIGEQIDQDAFSAEGYLQVKRFMKPRKDGKTFTGQDKSTAYAKARVYEEEEIKIMDTLMRKAEEFKHSDQTEEHMKRFEESLKGTNSKLTEVAQEAMVNDRNGFIKPVYDNPLENKSGVCITCKNTIDEGAFKGEEYYSKIFNNTGKIKCFDCLKNEIEGD